MDHAGRIAAVGRDLDALTTALAAGPLSADVPTCPGWTLTDLVGHVGGFCGFWTHVLCEGTGRDKSPFVEPGDADDLVGWFGDVSGHLREQLQATPSDTPVWTWHPPDQTAGFVARRCAHELAIHRYDAQSARDACRPVDRALAIDGIDELLGALVTTRQRTGQAYGETIHLHGTDEPEDPDAANSDAEWLVTLRPDRIDVARRHAKGDLALRGAVSDLELLLYRRPTLGAVERFGDEAVLKAWYREFTF